MIKKLTLIIFLVFASGVCFAQSYKTADTLLLQLANSKDDTSRVNSMNMLSIFYWAYKNDSALFFAQKALELSRKKKFPKGESTALNCLGLINNTLGDSPAALELFFKGLDIAKKNNINDETKANNVYNIGYTYMDVKDYSKAISYLHEAKSLYDSLHNNFMKQLAEKDLGGTYLKMNQLDSAMKYGQQAYNDMIRFNGEKTYTLNDFASIQAKSGNVQLALEYFKQSLADSTNGNNYAENSRSYFGIAKVYQQLNKPDSSIFYAQKSLDKAQQGMFYKNVIEASSLLAELYDPKDLQKAFQYSKMAIAAQDSLYSMGKRNAFRNITDFNQKERQYEIDTATATYQNKLRQYALLTGLAVFLLITFILYRNNLQKKKANKVLESTLTNLKSTQSQLIQAEKMASLGELTAGIAHEIQNPLNFVNNFSEVSTELLDEMIAELDKGNKEEAVAIADDVKQNLGKILHHGKRADGIVKGMLQHSRSSTAVKEPTDINKLADEYLRLAYHGLRAKDKSFNAVLNTDFDESIGTINVIPQDIGRAVLNLITNAFYVVGEKRKQLDDSYEPTVSVATRKTGDKIEIIVADNGNGIPPKVLDKIFQPFFTTKPTGQGTGLGLSLSYDIVKAHGGEIKVNTKENEGTEFVIQLPAKEN